TATGGEQDKLAQYAKYFPRGGSLKYETLWTDLSTYASDYGWAKATADEVRFQPEVAVPMTPLLSSEPIFGRPPRHGAWPFQDKAGEPNAAWASLMAESLFHLAHRREPGLDKLFGDRLDYARLAQGAGRREILDAITRSSFVDEEGQPRL